MILILILKNVTRADANTKARGGQRRLTLDGSLEEGLAGLAGGDAVVEA